MIKQNIWLEHAVSVMDTLPSQDPLYIKVSQPSNCFQVWRGGGGT